MMPGTVFVLNGPNLNLLGTREPDIYGTQSLADIEAMVRRRAAELGLAIVFRQSNHEGALIDWLHEAHREGARAVLLNAAGYTHSSIALLDACLAIAVPVIEVHLSDPALRESFRHHSWIAPACVAHVKGLGAQGYLVALDKAAELPAQSPTPCQRVTRGA